MEFLNCTEVCFTNILQKIMVAAPFTSGVPVQVKINTVSNNTLFLLAIYIAIRTDSV